MKRSNSIVIFQFIMNIITDRSRSKAGCLLL